jgi:hypothetical protein
MNRSQARVTRPVSLPLLAVAALLAALLAGTSGAHDEAHASARLHGASQASLTAPQVAFHDQMRKLWEDHVTWTRLAIVTFAAGPEDSFGATAGRLLQNQTDIGDAIKPFYGTAAGNRLTGLLKDHILIAVDVLTAAKQGDTQAFDEANARWYVNANDVADLLSSLNAKSWPQDQMRAMMKLHLDQTLAEAAAELGGDYAAGVASYEKIHHHTLDMADALSAGIIRQFPARFAG